MTLTEIKERLREVIDAHSEDEAGQIVRPDLILDKLEDMEREIELGGRDVPSRSAQGAALAGVRPLTSFAFTRVAISSSAVTSDAFQANRAS